MYEPSGEDFTEPTPHTESLSDLPDDQLDALIVELAERAGTELSDEDKKRVIDELVNASAERNHRHPRYREDPAAGKIGARSDLDDLSLPE